MHLGVDLDNTLVCYDGVFHRVGVAMGLLPASVGSYKRAVRDFLRAQGQEDAWTELQGLVYGLELDEAAAYPGARDVLARCRAAGVEVSLVSHRTRRPYRGPACDLHAAALGWLRREGLVGSAAFDSGRIFLEESKEAKLARIARIGCTLFVDDLPELLTSPGFPAGVRRFLFDPAGDHATPEGVERIGSWSQLAAHLGV